MEETVGSNVQRWQGPEASPTRPLSETDEDDTPARLRVRELAHALGYRFRLRRADLPESPDLAFPRLRRAVLVHDCLPHGHPGCPRARMPTPAAGRWHVAQGRDEGRDALAMLAAGGWAALIVWACETGDEAAPRARLAAFLGGD